MMTFQIILVASLLIGVAPQGLAGDKSEYQEKRQDYPAEAFEYPLIHFDLKGESPRISYLRFEEAGGGNQPRFDTQSISAGKELAIRGYWISKNLIDAYRVKLGRKGFEKGPGAPSYDEILKVFRSSDSKTFTNIISRLDEIRRNPENIDEALKVRNALDPKRKTEPEDYYDRAMIGTGMIEVEDPASSGDHTGHRRFIPLSLALDGLIAIDPQRARVKILQSVVTAIVSDSLLQDREGITPALLETFAALDCKSSPCATQGAVFAQVIESFLRAATTDNATQFDIMDSEYDEKLERAEREKLNRVLRELKTFCLP